MDSLHSRLLHALGKVRNSGGWIHCTVGAKLHPCSSLPAYHTCQFCPRLATHDVCGESPHIVIIIVIMTTSLPHMSILPAALATHMTCGCVDGDNDNQPTACHTHVYCVWMMIVTTSQTHVSILPANNKELQNTQTFDKITPFFKHTKFKNC